MPPLAQYYKAQFLGSAQRQNWVLSVKNGQVHVVGRDDSSGEEFSTNFSVEIPNVRQRAA
jgi:hypothetical protein